jgi:hypothetical protein
MLGVGIGIGEEEGERFHTYPCWTETKNRGPVESRVSPRWKITVEEDRGGEREVVWFKES